MDFKKMMEQAKQMQNQLEKSLKEFDEKIFNFEYQSLVSVEIYGSLKIKQITIKDKSIVDADDLETLEDIIAQCVNNAISAVVKGKSEITSRIAGPAMQGLM
ncbi:MAG: YbaB/EbfC family nucleoid-associated protein [Mycoplasma sp.]